jgi:hypothetical protein
VISGGDGAVGAPCMPERDHFICMYEYVRRDSGVFRGAFLHIVRYEASRHQQYGNSNAFFLHG